MSALRISQLADQSGVPASTLRFYESVGLLPTERTSAGYRTYGDEAVRRLAFITSAKHLGLPLHEIRELLDVWQSEPCASVRSRLLPLVRARQEEADQRVAELTAFSAHLSAARLELAGPSPSGPCGAGCGCVAEAGDERGGGAVAADPSLRRGELTATQIARVRRGETSVESGAPVENAHSAEIGSRADNDELRSEGHGEWRSQSVACSLTGPDLAGRVRDWQQALASAVTRTPIKDGLRIVLPADPALAGEVARLAAAEQRCCAFFDFALRLTPTALILSVRSPEAGRELLAELFGAAHSGTDSSKDGQTGQAKQAKQAGQGEQAGQGKQAGQGEQGGQGSVWP